MNRCGKCGGKPTFKKAQASKPKPTVPRTFKRSQ